MELITIIGGGLAGAEAAWQIARRGGRVRLFEMKPGRFSPSHRSADLGELVCSNSLKSISPENASGVIKNEMKLAHSLVLEAAEKFRVPAGEALAVDREKFSAFITERLAAEPAIEIVREEVIKIPDAGVVIIASGPLTSDALAAEIERVSGSERLYFYDAISPVIYAESIDQTIAFRQSRYGKGGADYINCPMTKEEYDRFFDALTTAETVPLRDFEQAKFFEGCLPVEEMARRGRETLCYGPMKPVGLFDPRTHTEPHCVVQLRQENISAELFGMVGFQTRLRHPEQERIFRMIPGLEHAEFARLGSMHRNTYLCSPKLLNADLSLKARPELFFAGQITGVEGYLESSACGIMAGVFALMKARGLASEGWPLECLMGGLLRHVTTLVHGAFSPMNANFGLLKPLARRARRQDKKRLLSERSAQAAQEFYRRLETAAPFRII